VGLAIVVVVAIVAALAISDDDESVLSAPDSTGPDVTQPAPTDPGDPATTTVAPTDLDAAVDEAIAFIEAEREREFTTRPVVEALDDAAFVDRYNALIDEAIAEDPAAVEAATVVYRGFGFIDPDEDLATVERAFGAAGVLGYYDPETNELVVRGGEVTPYFRTTLVHELTHALDDQLFELDRPEYDDRDDEVGFGLSAVVEGNARRVENAFYDSLTGDEQDRVDREEQGYASGLDFTVFRESYLVLQIAPYEFGEMFVDELLRNEGEDGIDAALQDPPTTSEQVVYLDKYLDRELAREVTRPTADPGGTVVEEGIVGQVPLLAVLSEDGNAFAASDGWAGDWYVAWTEGSRSCVRAVVVMEDQDEAEELGDAFRDWADSMPDATVAEDGDRVEITSCVG
jgi:hypothetical protein